MQVTGMPAVPTAGTTICLTVTGAAGPLKATSRGSAGAPVVVQSGTDPNTWTVCFTVAKGGGDVYLSSGGDYKTVSVYAF
jgi:hypothetical protein